MFAVLDDVYTVASKESISQVTAHVAKSIKECAGVQPKLGKFGMWSRHGGAEPPGIDALLNNQPHPAEPIWKRDLPPHRNGLVILGTPVGTPEFVQSFLDKRLRKQRTFWQKIQQVPDTQAAWLLLLYCAVPRANHLLRFGIESQKPLAPFPATGPDSSVRRGSTIKSFGIPSCRSSATKIGKTTRTQPSRA